MNISNIENIQDKCMGCFTCYNLCPKQAITMPLNNEGFFFPVIDNKKCVNCGLCYDACLINCKGINVVKPQKVVTVIGEDIIRRSCSSGGFFYYLSKYVLEKGGNVYGAVFDGKTYQIVHTSTAEVSLQSILRSKYVQSNIGFAYKKVRDDLDKNKLVCFSGTPCQIYGLKKFLNKEYANLITVDFVCHGVPSTGLFSDMLNKLEKRENSHIENMTFREKDTGWRKQTLKFYFKNGNIFSSSSSSYWYYKLFLGNITLRKSCYNCDLQMSHQADFTMKDYWEIQNDDDLGGSAICINTSRANDILKALPSEIIGETIDFNCISHAFKNHGDINLYKRAVRKRKSFFIKLRKSGLENTISTWYVKYCKQTRIEAKIKKFLLKIRAVIYKILRIR